MKNNIKLILWNCFILLFFACNKSNEKENPLEAANSLKFWSEMRSYPFKDLPSSGYTKAYDHMLKMSKNISERGASKWESLGPWNTAGRTLCVVFNPKNSNTIYAGSAGGGLWVNYSLGDGQWSKIETGFPVSSVTALAINQNDSLTMYIGTGEVYNYQTAGQGAAFRNSRGSYGMGILKTTDGGKTWSKSLDWSLNQQRGISAISISKSNPTIVYAATSEGIFKSNNAGQSWIKVLDIVMATDVQINPAYPDIVFAGCGNIGSAGHGIYRSIDGGLNWEKAGSPVPSEFYGKVHLEISPSEPSTIYATIGNSYNFVLTGSWLLRSKDLGDNWEVLSTEDFAAYQGWYSHNVAISPKDPDLVIVGGTDVYKSTDGGFNLAMRSYGGVALGLPPIFGPDGDGYYVHSDIHDVVFNPDDPQTVLFATDGGVFKSIDAGEQFYSCNAGMQTTQFYNGISVSSSDSTTIIGGLQDNSTLIYKDNYIWQRNIGGDGACTAIHPTIENKYFAEYQYLNLLYSNDKGNNWSYSSLNDTLGNPAFAAPFAISAAFPYTMYLASNYVMRSDNNGGTFYYCNNKQTINGDPIITLAVSDNNPQKLIVATAPLNKRPEVFYSINGGNSWTNITYNLPDRFLTDIVIDPIDDNEIYITLGGFKSSHVFKLNLGENSWIDISSNLPDVPTTAIIIDPFQPSDIYIGNDLGVFYSPNGGQSWTTLMDGLYETVVVSDLKISYFDKKIVVATHGNGIFKRNLVSQKITGTKAIVNKEMIKIWPNPSKTDIWVSDPNLTDKAVNLQIFDLKGNCVVSRSGEFDSQGNTRIDFSNAMLAGTYIIKIDSKDLNYQVINKFIKE